MRPDAVTEYQRFIRRLAVVAWLIIMAAPSITHAVTCPVSCPAGKTSFSPDDFDVNAYPGSNLNCRPLNHANDTECWQCALDCAKFGNNFGSVEANRTNSSYVIKDTLKITDVYGGVINGRGAVLTWAPTSTSDAPMWELADTQGMKVENLRIEVFAPNYLHSAFDVYDTTQGIASRLLRLDHVVVNGIAEGNLDYGIRFLGNPTPCDPAEPCDQNNDTSSIINCSFLQVSKSAIHIGHSQSQHHRLQDVYGSAATNVDTKFVELVHGDFDSEGGFREGFEDVFHIAAAAHDVNIFSSNSEGCQRLVNTSDTFQTYAYPVQVIGGRFAVDDIVEDALNEDPNQPGYSYVVHHSARGPMVVSGLVLSGTPKDEAGEPSGLKPVIHFKNLPNDNASYLQVNGVHNKVPGSNTWDLIRSDGSTSHGRVFSFANLCTDSNAGGAACIGYGGGMMSATGLSFSALTSMDLPAGHMTYCTNCGTNPTTRVCTSGGSGAWAKRVGSQWICEGGEATIDGSQNLTFKNLTATSNIFPVSSSIGFTWVSATGNTHHCAPGSSACHASATDSTVRMPVSNLDATRIECRSVAAPGTAGSSRSWTYTLMKNGGTTTLTCQIFETGTTCGLTPGSPTAFSSGDQLSLRIQRGGSAATSVPTACTVWTSPNAP